MGNSNTILIVDDEKGLRELLAVVFSEKGYKVIEATEVGEALYFVEERSPDVILLDYRLGDSDGLEMLRVLKEKNIDVPVIFMTAYGTEDIALKALSMGAYNYVEKPFRMEEMKIFVERALERQRLKKTLKQLECEGEETFNFYGIVGKSRKLRNILELIKKIGPSRSTVLLTGESGTGKEMVARAIHAVSTRSDGAFVAVNCGAIPENLMESELFGHKKGAFTGAVQDAEGLFKAASGGTIFLDEITEIPLHLQVKLLRAIETKTIRPLGSTKDEIIDVRIICATNKDIEEEVAAGRFREDLYYRINVIRIHMPPLRERREDIAVLLEHFLKKYSNEFGKRIKRFSHAALDILVNYHFPGNVRELDNIVERAVAVARYDVILPEDLPENVISSRNDPGVQSHSEIPGELPEEGLDLEKLIQSLEKKFLLLALEKAGWNKTKAAEYLKMKVRSFRYLCEKYGIMDKHLRGQR